MENAIRALNFDIPDILLGVFFGFIFLKII